MAETTAAARKAQITTKLDSLTERDRSIGREIGAKLADGKAVPPKLRTERATLREDIEDLTAALPHLDRQMQAETAAAKAAERAAATAQLSGVEDECRAWGEDLRGLLAPVVAHLETEGGLDSRYKAAQRALGGTANGHLAETAGVGIRPLMKLRTIIGELK